MRYRSLVWTINTSGLWGSGSDLQGQLLHDVQFGTVVNRPVEATFTPTTAGIRPDLKGPSLTVPNIQEAIASAIAQGIAAGLQQGAGVAPPAPLMANVPAPPVANSTTLLVPAVQRPLSLARSHRSQSPVSEDGKIKDAEFSGDEEAVPEKPSFSGLFQPAHFKILLTKDKSSATFATLSATPAPAIASTLADSFFTEQAVEMDTVPAPKLFLDVVQRQWVVQHLGLLHHPPIRNSTMWPMT